MTSGRNIPGLCRLCGDRRLHVFADLGTSPLANSYLRPEQLAGVEPRFPLKALVCERCFLVQLETLVDPRHIFSDYAYFSSYSDTLLAGARLYAETIRTCLALNPRDLIVEIGSNDGYLLQHFVGAGLNVLGIEPAANVAEVALGKGVPTLVGFFGSELAGRLASEGRRARLIIANNVVAHVPELNDFLAGLKVLLAPGGLITLEFHHLLRLIDGHQFDAIYHEHFQYFSLATACEALASHGLSVVDAEELPTQGGSLRVYARHHDAASEPAGPRVADVLAREEAAGLRTLAAYDGFAPRIAEVKRGVLSFIGDARRAGKSIVAYGAAAKGNTLLNYCGVGADRVDYAVDRSPHKQGLFLPGSRIPIYAPDKVMDTKPDYLLILAWNLRDEIMEQMSPIRRWGGRFVVPIPEVQILP